MDIHELQRDIGRLFYQILWLQFRLYSREGEKAAAAIGKGLLEGIAAVVSRQSHSAHSLLSVAAAEGEKGDGEKFRLRQRGLKTCAQFKRGRAAIDRKRFSQAALMFKGNRGFQELKFHPVCSYYMMKCRGLFMGEINSDVKGSAWFVSEFALIPFSPRLPSVLQVSKHNTH